VFAFNIAGATWLTEAEVVGLAAAALPGRAAALPRQTNGAARLRTGCAGLLLQATYKAR
jgi:hypothetical protein